MPHELTRWGSGTAATPGRSETRLVWRTLPAVDGLAPAAAAPAPIGTSDPTATNENAANSGLGLRARPDSCCFLLYLPVVGRFPVWPLGDLVGGPVGRRVMVSAPRKKAPAGR